MSRAESLAFGLGLAAIAFAIGWYSIPAAIGAVGLLIVLAVITAGAPRRRS